MGIAIMVGLAVDYIVHMSAAIAHCDAGGPAAVQAALRNVGMSVVSGAVTTIGASMFLLPCEMAVFQQFGASTHINVPSRSACMSCGLLLCSCGSGDAPVYKLLC